MKFYGFCNENQLIRFLSATVKDWNGCLKIKCVINTFYWFQTFCGIGLVKSSNLFPFILHQTFEFRALKSKKTSFIENRMKINLNFQQLQLVLIKYC